jgi:hypothetical protein
MFDPDADGTAVRHGFSLNGRFVVIYAGAHGLASDLGVVVQAADHGHRWRIWQSARGYVEAYLERIQQAEKLEGVLASLVGERKGQFQCS